MRLLKLLILAVGLAANVSIQADEFELEGWQEVVVSVRSLDDYRVFFNDIAQWKLSESGDVTREQLNAWKLPEKASARFQVFANPGTLRGSIRLVEFAGVEQNHNRADEQSWDTGGIFDLNMRVKDLHASAKQMRSLGWQSRAPITQFEFGPFEVKEWIVRSPDGLQIAFVQRLKPVLEGWPHFKAMSRPFNSTQVVKDLDAGMHFYEKVLGFKRIIEHRGASKVEAPNVLGIPTNYTTQIEREVYVLHPQKVNDGSVELLKFHGFDGVDHSAVSHFPNLGISLLRFPVSNLGALEAHLQKNDVAFIHPIQEIDGVKKITVSSPEGAWLEFYQSEK